ncbi:uncharacterized protein LOC124290823 [Haliotis rubra]|uniref:uncharacterized protein LOC124290823 n=1 Tax=Haliotis rubra TaxID=36100 RepID=UPI001EE4EFCE|nr:uncharacterized protein LOC124290823 [Haliotis rubra]
MCSEHKDECVKFLCKDCKKLTCQTCCIIYHRKCESVVTLESEFPALKSKLLNEKENILKKQMLMEKKVDTVKSNVITEKDRYVQMESKIKSNGIKARETITLKENKLLDELKEISDRHIEQLNAHIKSAEISVQMYRQQAELIDQTLQSDCDMNVYEMYQGCDAGDVEDVRHTDLKEKGRIARISFRQDPDKLSKAVDDLQLGEIDVLYDGVMDLAATPVLRDTIIVTVAGDTSDALPLDVTALVIHDTHTVVTTDNINMSVKSFYTRDNQSRHSKLRLDSQPWGLTKLQHNQVAVTVQNKTIITVEVNPDLVMLSTIKTDKQYLGITSLTPSTLAAGSESPPCVDILDMTGNVLRSVSPLCGETKILKNPYFLCTKRTGNILVSDYGSQRVLCLTPEGDVVFTYTPTGHTTQVIPRGIINTSTGDILVALYSQNNVVHLTESGQFVRNLLTASDDVDNPYGVCADDRGYVYVCNLNSGDINVFTCSDTE